MIGVIGIHFYSHFINTDNSQLADIIYRTSVVSIPLFFMVSGYLLLGRVNCSYRYSLNKICNIIRFVLIITTSWWLTMTLSHHNSDYTFIDNVFGSFIGRGSYGIFWYFGAMIIIYLIYPTINYLFRFQRPTFLWILLLLITMQSLAFIANVTAHGEPKIIQTFRIWNWLSYFMIGGILNSINKQNRLLICISMIVLFILNPIFQHTLIPYIGSSLNEYYYSSLFVTALVTSLFLFINNINLRPNGLISKVNALFLPVYAIHIIVIKYLPSQAFLNLNTTIGPVLYFIAVVIISLSLGVVIMNTPYINKIFRI